MGANKTASTTFQSLCKNSRQVLIDNGLLFPTFSTWNQHSFAAWMSQKRDIKNLSFFLNTIFNETKTNGCHSTLISGEDFENFIVDTHLAKEFEELAKVAGYKDIEWVFIRRNPTDYLLSIYSEMSAYKGVLDLELMMNIILEYGFVSVGADRYNWKFVFDIEKFSKIFKKYVNKNIRVLSFEEFVNDFAGKIILNDFVNNQSLSKIRLESKKIGVERKRHSPEKVEFRYAANFLGMQANKDFHENNKQLVDSLISHRVKRNNILIPTIKNRFQKRFKYS